MREDDGGSGGVQAGGSSEGGVELLESRLDARDMEW